jgi:thymidylate synthase
MNFKYHELLQTLLQKKSNASPRGFSVNEEFFTQLEINPLTPIPDFESRRFNWKYFVGELAWYLLEERKTDWINNFSTFWVKIENSDGTINSNYGHLLLKEKQLAWVIKTLQQDKESRQAIAYLGGKEFQYDNNKDFVCTQYILFYIRDNKLNMKVQMRSNDVFYGLSFDAPWFSTVMQNVYLELKETYPELELGKYYHHSDNTHFYDRHKKIAKNITDEIPFPGPKLILKEKLWETDLSGNTKISLVAVDFINKVFEMIKDNEEMTNDVCKNLLASIYNI